MYLMDYHHHTDHSFDSKAPMIEVCKQAIAREVEEICFTEHFSVNPLSPTYGHMNFKKYFDDIKSCQQIFHDQLSIKAGIELCEPHLLIDQYQSVLQDWKFDCILGSIHNINNTKLRTFYNEKRNLTVSFTEYFQEVFKMASIAEIDVLAHVDLLKRYSINLEENYQFNDFKGIIAEILKIAIKRNVGIEINTSGMRGKLQDFMPTYDVLKLYKDLGGELLTIGSDSHAVDTVGSHLKDAVYLAKEAGFRYLYIYSQRNPSPIKII